MVVKSKPYTFDERDIRVLAALNEATRQLKTVCAPKSSETPQPTSQQPRYKRTCPACANTGDLGHIYAALNDIRNGIYEAHCLCSHCDCSWDELFDSYSGQREVIALPRMQPFVGSF